MEIVGGVFGGVPVTLRRKLVPAVAVPSLTVTVIVVVPVWPVAGVIVIVRFVPDPPKTMLVLGTSVVFDEVPVTLRFAGAVSASPTVKPIGPTTVLTAVAWFGILEMVGGVLGVEPLTVRRKLELAVALPSFTVTVIVAVPVCPVAGVTVTVRFAPEPPKTILALGTRVEFDEDPLSVRFPVAVSASPTVKPMGPVEVFTWVV